MPAHLFIGAGAGLVSATLFASAMVASALAGLIIYLCPLPLCLAGLGWGRSAAGLAGLIGTILSALLLGPAHALAFALCLAIPVTALVHLILLSRTSTSLDNEAKPVLDWYPAGRLVAAAALIAGTIAALMLLALGPDMAGYNASVDEMLPRIHDALGAKDLVLVEGEDDLLTVMDLGRHNVVCGLRGTPNKEQLAALAERRRGKRTFLAFDDDEAGQELTWRLWETLAGPDYDVRVISWSVPEGAEDGEEGGPAVSEAGEEEPRG